MVAMIINFSALILKLCSVILETHDESYKDFRRYSLFRIYFIFRAVDVLLFIIYVTIICSYIPLFAYITTKIRQNF